MGGRKAASPAIQFVADFDFVTVGRTVAYKAGNVVEAPDEALIAAAGERAVPYSEPESPDSAPPATEEKQGDGQ